MQMERGAEKGTLWAGGCSPGSTPPTVPSPHMEGNESAGTGLFLLGFPVWVSLLLPFERAGSVRGCGKQLQEPESNPLGMEGGALPNAHVPSGSLLHLYLRALCRRNSGGLSARVGGGRDPPGQILQGLNSHPPTPLPRCVHTLTQSYRVCSALRSERWPPLGTQGDCSHHRLWEAHSGHWVGRGWGSARGQGQGDADGGVHSEPCPRAGAGLAQAQALREAPCPTLPPQQAPWSSGQVSPDPSSQGVRGAAGDRAHPLPPPSLGSAA